jgi:hypothetical protein
VAIRCAVVAGPTFRMSWVEYPHNFPCALGQSRVASASISCSVSFSHARMSFLAFR